MAKKVWVLPGDSRQDTLEMFRRHGFSTDAWPETADLICFLGGTDVSPDVYGAERHPMTQNPDTERDEFEVSVFKKFPHVPKVGICRGGQLLNVLNGGSMIQHLGETISGLQYPYDRDMNRVEILADHHQGIVRDVNKSVSLLALDIGNPIGLTYACYYPETKSLCYQGHPEWGNESTELNFFELLEATIGIST